MPTTIEVNKQSVEALLGSGKSKPFVIPEYQRPYAWTDEQVETLFEDLWDFTATSGGTERESSYFLGSVVSYENEDDEQEIIDGQQRITSLFLLLRAIYTKLIATPASERTAEANNFIGKIEPTIWRTNKLTGTVDFKNILLTSRVVNNEGNEILRSILETGKADEDAKDNYSKNYRHFQELFDKHSTENPLMVYQFIYALLNQAILLPITADTQDTALTIFSTLNDRGLPLSDADIFKAKIYNQLAPDDKKAFIDRWKDLDEQSTDANESIQQITDAHADRTGDATERTTDDERTEYHDGISEMDGCHIRTDRNLDLQEGEDCIGKRCEQSGKRELIGFRVIHDGASSGVFRHLPVLPCIIGYRWRYRNYQFIFILYNQMAG